MAAEIEARKLSEPKILSIKALDLAEVTRITRSALSYDLTDPTLATVDFRNGVELATSLHGVSGPFLLSDAGGWKLADTNVILDEENASVSFVFPVKHFGSLHRDGDAYSWITITDRGIEYVAKHARQMDPSSEKEAFFKRVSQTVHLVNNRYRLNGNDEK